MNTVEKPSELETKYQKLATEYSKVRSQATVLKKALLEEQTKNLELKELMNEQEQKLRKHSHEMESLTFRNDQLAKRISVLQQELQQNSSSNVKKGKTKTAESSAPSSLTIMDEELHKKILENAQLMSTMADKDLEISSYGERIQWLENKLLELQNKLADVEVKHKEDLNKISNEKRTVVVIPQKDNTVESNKEQKTCHNHCVHKEELKRWKAECVMLRAKPESNKELTTYYEDQIRKTLENEQLAKSEASSLRVENEALYIRFEQTVLEKNKLVTNLEKCTEELQLISNNYKSQLDAMTEHFAAQNEKITRQCDEIQTLKHKLLQKK